MKKLSLFFALIFFAGIAAGAQNNSQAQRPTLGQAPEQNRPTLGVAPSLGGPTTAIIMNAPMLRRVRTVYIGMMDNSLNLQLIQDLAKHGPFRTVDGRKKADAVLQGTCFNSQHLKVVHSEVFLTGRDGKAIWQDVIHQPYDPPPLSKAVTQTANLIIQHLRESIEQAGRR
ncbi:MAG: hypothetical protein ACRD2B_14760 [Terriglobia bacterium]